MNEIDMRIVSVISGMVALIATLLTVVGPFARDAAAAWLKGRLETLEARLPQNVQDAIHEAALLAARAVEQMQIAGYIENEGKAMLKRAEEMAEAWLTSQGYRNIELDAIRVAIENVIWSGDHKKETPPPIIEAEPMTPPPSAAQLVGAAVSALG